MAMAGMPVHSNAQVPASSIGTQDMHAYIAGNPSDTLGAGYQGYGFAYPIANYTSVLPQNDLLYVNSLGNSSVYVTGNGSTIMKLTAVPSGYGVFNLSLPLGTYMLTVDISSSFLGKSVTEAFSVTVLSPTMYKTYVSSHVTAKPVTKAVSPIDVFGMVALSMAFAVLLGTPISYSVWNRHRDKKGAVSVLEGFFRFGGKK